MSYKIKDGLTPMLTRLANLTREQQQTTKRISLDMKSEIELRFRKGETAGGLKWKPSARGGKTLVDTGLLRQSFNAKYDKVNAQVGTNIRYARIHNFGGVIKAKNKYLTIPVAKEAKGKSARSFQDTFIFKSKRTGNLFIAQKNGVNLKTLYLLKKQITVPARRFMGLNQRMMDKYTRWIQELYIKR